MERNILQGIYLYQRKIYRIVMFLFLLNVVYMMVFLWLRISVCTVAIDSFSSCRNFFERAMMNLEQTSIQNLNDMPDALRVETGLFESSLNQ